MTAVLASLVLLYLKSYFSLLNPHLWLVVLTCLISCPRILCGVRRIPRQLRPLKLILLETYVSSQQFHQWRLNYMISFIWIKSSRRYIEWIPSRIDIRFQLYRYMDIMIGYVTVSIHRYLDTSYRCPTVWMYRYIDETNGYKNMNGYNHGEWNSCWMDTYIRGYMKCIY